MANSVDPDQTAPIRAVCSGSTLFASILNASVMLGNYLQQTVSTDVIFLMHFFLALYGLTYKHVSEYGQEIQQSNTADQPTEHPHNIYSNKTSARQ